MKLYSVGTWDGLLNAYTVQRGLSVPSINVPLATLRQAMRELRNMGYEAHYRRDSDGEHWDNDPMVRIEETTGKSEAEILSRWKHPANPQVSELNADIRRETLERETIRSAPSDPADVAANLTAEGT